MCTVEEEPFSNLNPISKQQCSQKHVFPFCVWMGNAFFANQKILNSKLRSKKTKMKLYKALIRPVVVYGSECWVLTENIKQKLLVFERKVLRRIFVPTQKANGEWRRCLGTLWFWTSSVLTLAHPIIISQTLTSSGQEQQFSPLLMNIKSLHRRFHKIFQPTCSIAPLCIRNLLLTSDVTILFMDERPWGILYRQWRNKYLYFKVLYVH